MLLTRLASGRGLRQRGGDADAIAGAAKAAIE
jgi:hypothetical protein